MSSLVLKTVKVEGQAGLSVGLLRGKNLIVAFTPDKAREVAAALVALADEIEKMAKA